MLSKEEIEKTLPQFYGTTQYHKFNLLTKLVATDGVMWLANNAGCFWLLEIIMSYQRQAMKDPMLRDIQFWKLTAKDGKGVVTCERDTDDVAIRQEIPYTDFPLDEIKIWVENGVVMLPSER